MILVDKKLRVKHFPQIPCKAFEVEVKNEREAYLIQETLADQHNFLYRNSFIEQMDNTVKEAKAEVESFITRRVTEEGRKALLGEDGKSTLFIEQGNG